MGKAQKSVPVIDSPHSEASKLLEAALQQMDGIISGVGTETETRATLQAADRLAAALLEAPLLPPLPDTSTLNTLRTWLQQPNQDIEDHIRRLESDKESLTLQVTVLHEQIDAQSEKISDLEKILDDKKKQLSSAEDILHREMLTRSSLETQKLEFLAVVSELKRQQAALERENCELRDRLAEERRRNKPPIVPRSSPFPMSTPNNSQALSRGTSPSPSPVPNTVSPRKITEHQDDMHIQNQQQTPLPPYRRAGEQQYSSLPRQSTLSSETPKKGVAFAETETVVINDVSSDVDGRSHSPHQSPSPSLQVKKSNGIKRIFGRMKRSGSGNLDDLPGDGEFKRGGIRATAGARLGWSSHTHTKANVPFSEWNLDTICDWLMDLGLESCVPEAKNWVKNGAQLLAASTHDIEKELGLKNPLHRKKLHLALHCFRGLPGDSFLIPSGYLDTTWVLRWLDDVGLPQHKDAFLAARVDGRLLHRLTVDDLTTLHVTSVLHVASIRTSIQVLRSQNFEPNCLIRRSDPDEPATEGTKDVALWTNHRVMEWLRVVDLAEYAPNLRGSGVHGGLLVYEPRFTGELLASLLSIPPGKTLLRRHLMTHFKELLGREVIQEKREAEASLGYVPLTATAKMKVVKKSQFTLKRKKSKSELDYGELVCALSQSRAEEQAGESLSVSGISKTTQSPGVASHEVTMSPSQNGIEDKVAGDRNSTV
uniref:SAM domain-containing protein n=1 Tax=Clastoptera arizonana TaxID=38151 RepID=A0A1B6DJ40_9HEMI